MRRGTLVALAGGNHRDERLALPLLETKGGLQRWAIYTMRTDGTDKRRITAPPWGEADRDAAWSPDRRSIAFSRDNGVDAANIFTVRVDGTGLRQLTFNTPGEETSFYPTYSPDGRRIIHGGFPCVGDCADLFMMNANGSHDRPVTRTPGCEFQSDWGT